MDLVNWTENITAHTIHRPNIYMAIQDDVDEWLSEKSTLKTQERGDEIVWEAEGRGRAVVFFVGLVEKQTTAGVKQ